MADGQASKNTFDVLVIGGGPAGMMAAGRAAELGASVVVAEKNARPGVKLLMTGGGRCNLTNENFTKDALAGVLGRPGRSLYPSFAAFGPREAMAFFAARGVPQNVEDGGRVFPASGRARDVLSALTGYMREGGVKLVNGCAVKGLVQEGGIPVAADTTSGRIAARAFVICTGGMSYPASGSTGDGYGMLAGLGHTIATPAPALTPVRVREAWVRDAEGASLRDVTVSAWLDGKRRASVRGAVIFTRDGVSGPAALDISGVVGGLLGAGDVTLRLDMLPDIPAERVDEKLIAGIDGHPKMLAKNFVERYVVPKLAPAVMKVAGLDPALRLNGLPRQGRTSLGNTLKGLTLGVTGLHGFKRAMVTSGGVVLSEVEQRTMRSKLAPNVYIAGELLDITGPTGGYNLQICWSTGYAAGGAAAAAARQSSGK